MGVEKNVLKKINFQSMGISSPLLSWFDTNKRILPFRENNKPYNVWISEVMLQQTKVDTVIPYFNEWIKKFPNIKAVADASEESILKCWEGLGYYARCRNFHRAAKIIVKEYNSIIPDTWDEFRSLPGVGDYTAGAVLSIAFNKNYVAIDGNVKRVMARLTKRRKLSKYNQNYIKSSLNKHIDKNRPGDFNQALMELGACVCLPQKPKCVECPISKICSAYKNGSPTDYPIKEVKKKIPQYIFAGGIIRKENKILIQKRDSRMLKGLWEIPMVRVSSDLDLTRVFKDYMLQEYGITIKFRNILSQVDHTYSHFKMKLIVMDFIQINDIKCVGTSFSWISMSDIDSYAFHKANHKIFKLLNDSNLDV